MKKRSLHPRGLARHQSGHGVLRVAAAGLILLVMLLSSSDLALANPVGPVVVGGQAMVTGLGTPVVTIQQATPRLLINWQSFNIEAGELTQFVQPSAAAMALNRILDQNPTQIFGSLEANGIVLLLNPNGVLFGPHAQVNVHGLIASSLNVSDQDFLNGRLQFEGAGTEGTVQNAGTIQTDTGGFIYLFAPNVQNSGLITSPEGQLTLAAGSTVYLTDRPDGRGFLVQVQAPAGVASNLNELIADGGEINLYGRTVNQSGLVQANSVEQVNGQIQLVASDRVNLTAGSRIAATGDAAGVSDGGSVTVRADQGTTDFESGAVIDISGGVEGGNAGSVELSGDSLRIDGRIIGHAVEGYGGGSVLIDPDVVDQALLMSTLESGFATGITDFTFHSDTNLTVSGVSLFLGQFPVSGSIAFDAGGDLLFNNSLLMYDTGGTYASFYGYVPWDLSLTAGRDVALQNSLVGTGGGGDLTVTAGRDVISPSALNPSMYGTLYTGLRLDDLQPGTLTIEAGRDFLGGFVLTSGTADVTVGRNLGSSTAYANLTLGTGQISVDAGADIYLGLVQDQVLAEGRGYYYEDNPWGLALLPLADPGNAVNLLSEAGSIYLHPHSTESQVQNSLEYYPASFSADAPEGSIVIGGSLAFWPSATGNVIFSARDEIMGVAQNGQTPVVRLIGADPALLRTADLSNLLDVLRTPAPSADVATADLAPVQFETELGDIHDLVLDLRAPSSLPKQVTISSGRDLTSFAALISAYQCLDVDCPQIVSAAGNIDMTRPALNTGVVSGVTFYGNGHAEVVAGGDLNLADSDGIRYFQGTAPSPGGLLDLAVGGNLEMTTSRILTYNGASIAIHGLEGADSAVGGSVDVGTDNAPPFSTAIYGIVTLSGGDIDIKANGDVNVNDSRVATLSGGNIDIESVHGDINAGTGARDELVGFVITVRDQNGNVVLDPLTGEPQKMTIYVPGSGIFTFHPDDPNPLPPYPPAPPLPLTPLQNALVMHVIYQTVAGHELSSSVNAEYQSVLQAVAKTWGTEYAEIIDDFTKDWKLGDITLTALEGNVVVPPAGIRGKNIRIKAKNLTLLGGQILGNLIVDVNSITGNQNHIAGPLTGNTGAVIVVPSPTSAAGLSGLSGTTGSLSSSVTSMTTTVAEKVQDEAVAQNEAAVASSDKQGGSSGHKKKSQGIRLKHGVTIEVEVKEAQP